MEDKNQRKEVVIIIFFCINNNKKLFPLMLLVFQFLVAVKHYWKRFSLYVIFLLIIIDSLVINSCVLDVLTSPL